jgi:hypothetical protein
MEEINNRKGYQREYHRHYRLKKRIENGIIERKPMKKLKSKIADYIDEGITAPRQLVRNGFIGASILPHSIYAVK